MDYTRLDHFRYRCKELNVPVEDLQKFENVFRKLEEIPQFKKFGWTG
jgi:hypothetical protein